MLPTPLKINSMKRYYVLIYILISAGLFSCSVNRNTPKYSFANGYYFSKVFNQQQSKVYVNNTEDSIFVYQADINNSLIDITKNLKVSFPQQKSNVNILPNKFRQTSFDVDFLTIPFKFRPEAKSFPPQFNTNLNGAVYLGYRNDLYRLSYKKTPLNAFNRQTSHYGFSIGIFTGLGGTAINPSVTNNGISFEYDGVLWTKGLAAIIGINNFTIGLALGWDNLLDNNRSYWIYQEKPWLGLAFGLNIN